LPDKFHLLPWADSRFLLPFTKGFCAKHPTENGDGFITAEEAEESAQLQVAIAESDADEDGMMNDDEFNDYLENSDPPDSGG
jgi:hypothetical protein